MSRVNDSAYEDAITALSSLITKRSRSEKSNRGNSFHLLPHYVKILELEEPISKLKVIHVSGTKGKGSTCVFSESILRNCGFHTGLFTSPHLIDVRERFRLDGVEICKENFLGHFWWCYDRLKEKTTDDIPMPTYFHFLALLAFKIFSAEQVDVAILEVGLGGRFDATNVVQEPIVCGVSSLGYDHMEILGDTLGQIAGQKAGIFKKGVPAFTVPQLEEAMRVLEENASKLNVKLQVALPLNPNSLNGLQVGLNGEHQLVNAGLAVALCSTWLQRTGHHDFSNHINTGVLPEQFIKGLTTASFQGRGQIVSDGGSGNVTFYLDGAHSPESMDVCGTWFSHAIKENEQTVNSIECPPSENLRISHGLARLFHHSTTKKNSSQILLFNCMPMRDPQLLLPRLMKTCASHGVQFEQALFVPNISMYHKVITNVPQPNLQVDLSWQLTIQRAWENLITTERKGRHMDAALDKTNEGLDKSIICGANSKVFPTLPLAIKWLRNNGRRNQHVQFQVLVTGSLHLVGDILRLIRK